MNTPSRGTFTGLLFIWLIGTSVAAPYAYVDADLSNTTVGGAAPVNGTNSVANGTTGSSSDNLWTLRYDSAAASYEDADYLEFTLPTENESRVFIRHQIDVRE